MIVLGGGPVGCELGQAFARLGVKVTILQSGARLLAKEDADVAGLVRRRLEAEDVRVITAAKATRVTREGGLYRVRLEAEHKVEEIEAEAMLVAAGRAPNLEGLALEKAGVAFDKKGVRVNEQLQTTAPHIYAAGHIAGSCPRLLDLGTGTGALVRALGEELGKLRSATGCDLSFSMLRHARRHVPELRPVMADATQLPFCSGTFGLVTANGRNLSTPASGRERRGAPPRPWLHGKATSLPRRI
jgi:hypothetical protein